MFRCLFQHNENMTANILRLIMKEEENYISNLVC